MISSKRGGESNKNVYIVFKLDEFFKKTKDKNKAKRWNSSNYPIRLQHVILHRETFQFKKNFNGKNKIRWKMWLLTEECKNPIMHIFDHHKMCHVSREANKAEALDWLA